jgi:hypothetical protein
MAPLSILASVFLFCNDPSQNINNYLLHFSNGCTILTSRSYRAMPSGSGSVTTQGDACGEASAPCYQLSTGTVIVETPEQHVMPLGYFVAIITSFCARLSWSRRAKHKTEQALAALQQSEAESNESQVSQGQEETPA